MQKAKYYSLLFHFKNLHQNCESVSESSNNVNMSINSCLGEIYSKSFGVLATVLINVKDNYESKKLLHCVIDIHSTNNFISELAIQLFRGKKKFC